MDRRLLRSLVPPRDRIGPDPGCDDARLLDRYGECRDERAFEELLTRHGPAVWGVCRRMLLRSEDAEDAFQATFVALIRLAESGKRPRNLAGWLVKVAGRVCLDSRRQAGRARRRESGAARPEADIPLAERSYDAAYDAFREEVAALPQSLRVAYLVCELGGTPQPLACRQLGLKPSALTARLTRARQRLEARLTARGLAPSIAAVVLAGTATTLSAMPTRLVIAVQTLSANPAVIPTALAATGVPLMLTKLKLATLAGLAAVAGTLTLGVGGRLLPGAGAQAPPVTPAGLMPPKLDPPVKPPAPPAKPAAEPDDEQLAATADNRTVFRVPEALQRKFEYRYRKLPAKLAEFQKLLDDESLVGFEYVGPVPVADAVEGLHLFKRERVRLGEIKLMPDPNEEQSKRQADVNRLVALALTQARQTAEAKPLTAQLVEQAQAITNVHPKTLDSLARARAILEVARDAYPSDATASPLGRLRRAIERAVEAIQVAEAGLRPKAPPAARPPQPAMPATPAQPLLEDAVVAIRAAWDAARAEPDPESLAPRFVAMASIYLTDATKKEGVSNAARAETFLAAAIDAYNTARQQKFEPSEQVYALLRKAITAVRKLDAAPVVGAATVSYPALASSPFAMPPQVAAMPPADPLAALPRTMEGTIAFVELTPGGLDIPEAMELIAAWYKPLAVRIVPAARDRLLLIDIHGDQEKTATSLVEAASALKKQGKYGPAERAKILAEPGQLVPVKKP